MNDYAIYVRIGSGILTAISMLPQLIKLIKEKKAEDLSAVMLLLLMAGVGGWIWYGILKVDYPIIITNSFSFVVNSLMIFFSIRYNKSEVADRSSILQM